MSLANNNSRGQNNVSISKYTMKDTSEGHTYGNLCFKYAEYIPCTMSHIQCTMVQTTKVKRYGICKNTD